MTNVTSDENKSKQLFLSSPIHHRVHLYSRVMIIGPPSNNITNLVLLDVPFIGNLTILPHPHSRQYVSLDFFGFINCISTDMLKRNIKHVTFYYSNTLFFSFFLNYSFLLFDTHLAFILDCSSTYLHRMCN